MTEESITSAILYKTGGNTEVQTV